MLLVITCDAGSPFQFVSLQPNPTQDLKLQNRSIDTGLTKGTRAQRLSATIDLIMLFIIVLVSCSVVFAATTAGPLAPVSIKSLLAYSTAKPCAAGCLVYNGIWVCGVNQGYHDLGQDLGCGCGPINACWCSAGLQPSATSYISSCISAGCSKFPNVDQDITSMLDLYGGYCATANVEASSKPADTKAVTTPPAAASSPKAAATGSLGVSSATAATGDVPASTTASDTEAKEDEGLSKSDIIALATGLGVGIPSLAIGALALWFQLRRRRATAEQLHSSVNVTPSESQTQFFLRPTHTPTPPVNGYPHVYELDDRGGQMQPAHNGWR